ncbi:MAG TPA: GNAT family N-acetyltransferase [Fimbriimonadaceae bacterium]
MLIEQLASHHVRTHFDCGTDALNNFIIKLASQHDARGFGKTYVALMPGETDICGYLNVCAGSVEFENVPEDIAHKLPKHPLPVLHLSRMAVHKDLKEQGIGKLLLVHCFKLATTASEKIGIHAVDVVAKDEAAKKFYLHFGFKQFLDSPNHLFLPLKVIKQLGL